MRTQPYAFIAHDIANSTIDRVLKFLKIKNVFFYVDAFYLSLYNINIYVINEFPQNL